MGTDKALLELEGQTLVGIALGTLREFCAEVAIAGSRPDLAGLAAVIPDLRPDCGPAAALEAGLAACGQPWGMFVPVDVPRVPAELLRRWAEFVLASGPGVPLASYLRAGGREQPAFCLLRRELAGEMGEMVGAGERRLMGLWRGLAAAHGAAAVLAVDAEELGGGGPAEVADWFENLNTPEDLRRIATR